MDFRRRARLWAGVLLLALTALPGCGQAAVEGLVVDYRTAAPIADATVTLTTRGWGFSAGQLVWDKQYRAEARTDAAGRFLLEHPGPLWVTGAGRLALEAAGFQRLTEIPAVAGVPLILQALPAIADSVPGGIAHLGLLADGTPFGWSFVGDRPVTDLAQADVYPLAISFDPLEVVLAAPEGGGVALLPNSVQDIRAASYGRFLRYPGEAPSDGYQASVRLTADTAGTVFVRTRDNRYAKLAFEPARLGSGGALPDVEQPVAAAVQLPFAYNPLPGRALPFDPTGSVKRVDPAHAAAAAEVPAAGQPLTGARWYRLELRRPGAATADAAVVRLVPGMPMQLAACRPPALVYELQLSYDSDGLPRVRVSVQGETFAHHMAPALVSRRLPTEQSFDDYGRQPPVRYGIRLLEVEESTEGEHARCL